LQHSQLLTTPPNCPVIPESSTTAVKAGSSHNNDDGDVGLKDLASGSHNIVHCITLTVSWISKKQKIFCDGSEIPACGFTRGDSAGFVGGMDPEKFNTSFRYLGFYFRWVF
jgi:hypothetical protein